MDTGGVGLLERTELLEKASVEEIKEKNKAKNNRIIYLDLLRIITCFSVVLLHTAGQNWNDLNPTTTAWQVFNLYDGLVRFAVPVMVMISGVFFLDASREIPLKKLYGKYILRLLSAYIFWSFFYAFYKFYITGQAFTASSVKTILIFAINSYYHLWFLPMMIGIYMLVPFLQLITKHGGKKSCQYFIALFLLFGVVIASALRFHFPYYEYVKSIATRIPVEMVSSYIGYFVLGYYLYTYSITKKVQNISYLLGIGSVLACIIGTSLYSIRLNVPNGILYDYFMVTTFFASAALFIFFKYQIARLNWSDKSVKTIQSISMFTFGVYLIHAVFLSHFKKIGFDTLSFNAVLSVPVIAAIIFLLSLLVTVLIRKIPFIHKYIM